MRNLYNMSIPGAKSARVSLTEQASEIFRTANIEFNGNKVKNASEDVKDIEIGNEPKEVIETIVEQPETKDVEIEDFLDINDLKVNELKEILDSKGVDYSTTIKKAGLIELVREV